VPTVLVCSSASLEGDLAGSPVMAPGVERYFASKLEEARTLALAARPEIVLIDRELPRAVPLIEALRADPSTRRLSIAVLARGDFDPGEVAFLEAGANAILRLPPDSSWADRIKRLMEVSVRKAARLPVSFAIGTLPRDGGTVVPALALNLSVTGMLLESSLSLEVGEELGLEFMLPGEPEAITAHGRVMRKATNTQFGLEFTTLPNTAQLALGRYLADRAGL
jgi:hypothetical protein